MLAAPAQWQEPSQEGDVETVPSRHRHPDIPSMQGQFVVPCWGADGLPWKSVRRGPEGRDG